MSDVDTIRQEGLQPVVLVDLAGTAGGSGIIGAVGGLTVDASANFTRPSDTTAYASGDLVANSTTAGSVAPMQFTVARATGGSFMIRRVRIKKNTTTNTNASFRLHLYLASPTATNGDNGAWLTTESTYIGSLDVTMDKVFSDFAKGIGSPNTGSEINAAAIGGRIIYGLLEARAAYTPASGEVFTVTLEVLQN